jgi:hypothetical protein
MELPAFRLSWGRDFRGRQALEDSRQRSLRLIQPVKRQSATELDHGREVGGLARDVVVDWLGHGPADQVELICLAREVGKNSLKASKVALDIYVARSRHGVNFSGHKRTQVL